MADPIIRTEGLTKAFGEVKALKRGRPRGRRGHGLRLARPQRRREDHVVRILTTLLQPDGGSATVAGCDVVRDAEALRFRIGLAGQSAAVDENLTGLENLELVGRLYHLRKAEARAPRRPDPGTVRALGRGRSSRQDLLGRDAPAPRRRREPGRAAAGPVPRRADDRPRPPRAGSTSGSSSGSCRPTAPPCC